VKKTIDKGLWIGWGFFGKRLIGIVNSGLSKDWSFIAVGHSLGSRVSHPPSN
jgi:hypothetical protein